MIKLTFVSPSGARHEIAAMPGGNLMELALAHDVEGILGDCGGSMVCGTCHVVVPERFQACLPAQQESERELLEYVPDPQPSTRLCCQIPVTAELDGLELFIPEQQR